MSGTHVDTEKINAAEMKIAAAIQSVRVAVDQLNSHTQAFQTAAGSNAKNGNLQQQSQTDGSNKQKQYTETNETAQKDQDTARAVSADYSNQELDNSSSLRAAGADMGHIVGF